MKPVTDVSKSDFKFLAVMHVSSKHADMTHFHNLVAYGLGNRLTGNFP